MSSWITGQLASLAVLINCGQADSRKTKLVIGKLASSHQNAFIKHRQITDAAAQIANEVLDWRITSGDP